MRRALSGSLALCACLTATPAGADASADPTAAALFRKGRELVESGNWEQGCAQFRASLARVESASIVLNIARCEEHFGRVATAWALYQRGRTLARAEPTEQRRQALERVARDGVTALEPRLPHLRVVAAKQPGLEVRENGRPFPVGVAVPLDPGTHEIVASAPGFSPSTHQVELREGKTNQLAIELTPLSEATPDERETPALPPPVASRERARPTSDPGDEVTVQGSVPSWAWIAGGAGIVLTGAAVGFALDARAAADSLERKCGSDLDCDEDPSFDPGPTNARKNRGIGLAIGLGSAGLIAIGASIFGISSAPKSARVSPVLVASERSVWLGAGLEL